MRSQSRVPNIDKMLTNFWVYGICINKLSAPVIAAGGWS